MRRLHFPFRKHRAVAGKALSEAKAEAEAALELEACPAENNALRAQVADLLRSRDVDKIERHHKKEQHLETTATLETTAMPDSSVKTQVAEGSAGEVLMLRK